MHCVAGKGAKPSHRPLSRNIIPPPLMDDLWKWEEQVLQVRPHTEAMASCSFQPCTDRTMHSV